MFGKNHWSKFLSMLFMAALVLSNFQTPPVEAQGSDGLKHQKNAQTGKVSFIGPEKGKSVSAAQALGVSPGKAHPADPALALAKRFAPEFGLKNPSQELKEAHKKHADNGRLTVKYQQEYQGIPVMGGELIVNTNEQGDLYSINGEVSPDLSLPTEPQIDSAQAIQTALRGMAKWYEKAPADFVVTEPELWVFDESLLGSGTRPAELVWRMEVTSKDNDMPVRELVLVNAERGSISFHFNQIDAAWHAAPQQEAISISGSQPELSTIDAQRAVSTSNYALVAATWYVANTGNDANSCASTGSPCATIQQAVYKAASGDTILVATGTYTGTGFFVVDISSKNLAISGGWNAGFTTQTGASIVDGQNARGGIKVFSSTVNLSNFIVQNGTQNSSFAGVQLYSGNLTISNTTIKDNNARGINLDGGSLTLINTTVTNNTGYEGAGIRAYCNNCTLDIQNSTITNNTSSAWGGGLWVSKFYSYYPQPVVNLRNSILAGNLSTSASVPKRPDCSGVITTAEYSIIGDPTGCTITTNDNSQIGILPEISAFPVGTPPYHALYPDSPAIDAGNAATCPATDERGVARPQGSGCDIGAYEYKTPESASAFGKSQGSNQRIAPFLSFPKALVAYVVDSFGSPVSGVSVTFTAPASGASGTFTDTGTNTTTALTDGAGLATATKFTANNQAGSYNVTATVNGLPGSVNFSLINAGWYVSSAAGASDSNACSTPAAPCSTINGAIGKAQSGDTIFVTASTFTGNGVNGVVSISNPITISGGWDNSFTTQSGFTTVDGQQARRGILVNAASVNISRVIVENGYTPDEGGGISGSPNLTDCIIRNNQAKKGGGIYGSSPNITNCSIHNNSAIYSDSTGGHGGGIYLSGAGTVINSTIYDNFASTEGGGFQVGSSSTINNSTIVNNHAQQGGGVHATASGSIFRNSIIANNTATLIPWSSDIYGTISQSHNITGAVSPLLFPSPVGKPEYFPLVANSLAIGMGDPATCAALDQRGVARPQGGTCDAGSFEYMTPGAVSKIDFSGDTSVHGAPGYPLLYPMGGYFFDAVGNPVPGTTVNLAAPSSGPSGTFADTGLRTSSFTTDPYGFGMAALFTPNDQLGQFNIDIAPDGGTPAIFTVATGLRYVSVSGGDDAGNSCDNAMTPCATVDAAIASATPGEGILVTAGTYTSSNDAGVITISKDIIISGGWNSDFTLQNGQTIIDGQNTRVGISIDTDKRAGLYSLIVQNASGRNGAGIFNDGYLTVKNVAIINNRSNWQGAGIFQQGDELKLENVTISNNIVDNSGGGIYILDGTVTINNSTITQNVASYAVDPTSGGGLSNPLNKPVMISNTIIAGNVADNFPDCYGQLTSDGHNLIGVEDGCLLTASSGDQIGISGQPLDAKLGNLLNNGGETYTHVLLPGSPAIDAGDSDTCTSADQRGTARPQGLTCDIGAYEGSETQALTPVVKTFSAGYDRVMPGALVCDQTDPDCAAGDDQAKAAHTYSLGTYEFYLTNHGRQGIDNNNGPVFATVNYCSLSGCPYYNAFWSGAQMVFGNNFPLADDVVAHEFTHGVTQYESDLYYFYQAGAINESFSDLWGEYYDQTNGLGNDAENVKWLIGEDISGVGATRSMKNPPTFGDPDRMMSSLYNRKVFYDENWDNGGVHSNSGVNNKAVYLMVDGGTFNNKTVTALGWEKVAAIYYEAQTNLLVSASDYSDLYYALQQACTNLIGQHGIVAADCLEVRDTVDAVQMNMQPVSNFNPDAPLCPTGMTTDSSLTLFADDFENGDGNWTIYNQFSPRTGFASSPNHVMWGDDSATGLQSLLITTSGISLPAGSKPFLHFKHAFAFEYYDTKFWDGGVLEYSDDGGYGWKDAKPLFSAGQNYKGTVYKYPVIYHDFGSILQGKPAFVGDSHGYVSSRYDLSSMAGQTIFFRWRMGTDWTDYYRGWFIDDVQVYTCVGVPTSPLLQAPADNVLLTGYTSPLLNWSDSTPSLDHYQVQVADENTFAAPLYDADTFVSEYQLPAGLSPNTAYFWRVRSFNSLDTTKGWSKVFSFRAAMLSPVVNAPDDLATLTTRRPVFDWDDVVGATGYKLVISKYANLSSPLKSLSVVDSQFLPPFDLPAKTKLYWRVQATGPNGPSVWSTTRSFKTGNPPGVPTLLKPLNNALTKDYTPLLDWSTSTVPTGTTFKRYELQVDDNNDFSSPEINASTTDGVIAESAYTPSSDLAPNTKYYWRVRAVNDVLGVEHFSGWSKVWTLRAAMLSPVLLLPLDQSTEVTLKPLFDWEDVTGAVSYTIQISVDPKFGTFLVSKTVNDSTFTPTTNLPRNKTIYWRVKANGPNGPSYWSKFQFITPP